MGTIVNKDEYYRRLMQGNFVYDYPFSITEESASYFDSIIELIEITSPRICNIIGQKGIGKSMFARYISFKKNINYIDSSKISLLSATNPNYMHSVFARLEKSQSKEYFILDDLYGCTAEQYFSLQKNTTKTLFTVTEFPFDYSIPPDLYIIFSKAPYVLSEFYKRYPQFNQIEIIVINPDSYLKPNSKEICFSRVM